MRVASFVLLITLFLGNPQGNTAVFPEETIMSAVDRVGAYLSEAGHERIQIVRRTLKNYNVVPIYTSILPIKQWRKLRYEINIDGILTFGILTKNGFDLMLCHEVGHAIGGYPTKRIMGKDFPVEGQADYFAAAKCFKKLFQDNDNIGFVMDKVIPNIVIENCDLVFRDQQRSALCQRTAMAAMSLASYAQGCSLAH